MLQAYKLETIAETDVEANAYFGTRVRGIGR
jgi:hypothetical protein